MSDDTKIDDGGPAHPCHFVRDGISPVEHTSGITMRDYFAAMALIGFTANTQYDVNEKIAASWAASDPLRAVTQAARRIDRYEHIGAAMQTELEQKAYLAYQQVMDFKPGDTVIVTHDCPRRVGGWENGWGSEMRESVGKSFVVNGHPSLSGVPLNDGYSYPAFCLRKMSKPPKPHTLSIDGGDPIELTDAQWAKLREQVGA